MLNGLKIRKLVPFCNGFSFLLTNVEENDSFMIYSFLALK